MKRSSSWPQVNILEDDYEDFLYPEVIIERLQQWVSHFERQNTQLEAINLEKADLQIINRKLIENSILSSQKILNLESEKNRLMAWLQEAETLVGVMREDLEKADREKRAISWDLGIQKQAFEIVDNSKKQLEKQMEMFSKEIAQDRNLIESQALEELGSLTKQFQALESQLKAKQEAAQQVEVLTIENKNLQVYNRELIKQNAGLERQLNELQERFELQKEQNELLRLEVKDTIVQNTCNISLDSIPYEPTSIKISSPITSHASTLTPQTDEMTPPLVFLQDYGDKTSVSYSDPENQQQQNPVDEYIRLSVRAVKMHFPHVSVSNDRLIEKAKMVPIYRVHDVLSSYLRKLEHKQGYQKEMEMQQSLCDNRSPSILEKVRGFIGCGVMLDYSLNNQCSVMGQVLDESRKRYGQRVRF